MNKSEGKMEKLKEVVEKALNIEEKRSVKSNVCTMCGKPATQLVDGEPSCESHIEQVYEHQVEDYTSKHLSDNEWRKF
jgi:protein-arginine kinase activator protein McsA